MNRYKLGIIFAILGIIFSSFLMILSTYAYFTVPVEGESKDIELIAFNDNTDIVFKDTSNVSVVNFYTGEEINKTFTVTNTSNYVIYYDITLNNVVNNFENPDDLVYEFNSDNNGAYRNQSIMPTSDETLASYVRIEPGITQTYQMKITFLDTKKDQSANMNKTFSSNIKLVPSKGLNVGENIYKNNSLLEKIINSCSGSANQIDFNNIDITDGIFYTNSSNDGVTTYFYRGSNELKNNVLMDNICYKILRTTENSDIRLVYNGEYIDGVCGSTIIDTKSSFNLKSDYNAYVGYMYGDANSANYKSEHSNNNSSRIKNLLEKWYDNNLKNNNNISDNTIYCNNRKLSEFIQKGVLYGTKGYSSNNTGYISSNNTNYTYYCHNINDRLSKKRENTMKVLNDSIGLLTLDELMYAGYNSNNFLYSSDSYWTMSPAYYNGYNAYNFSVINGKINKSIVTDELGIRPVITIKKDTIVKSGDGSIEFPYLID